MYSCRASVYEDLKQYEKALADYNKAVELGSENSCDYSSRGYVKWKLGDLEGCLVDFNKAIDLGQTEARMFHARADLYFALKRYHEALTDYDEAFERYEKNERDDISIYETVASKISKNERFPEVLNVLFNKACVYDDLQNLHLAIETLNKLIELCPFYLSAYINRSGYYQDLKEYEKALADIRFVLEKDPDDEDALEVLKELQEGV
jgi:tetratricopeptide (TPR) repeat protein